MHTQAALLKELEEGLVRSLKALADEEAVLREREVGFLFCFPSTDFWSISIDALTCPRPTQTHAIEGRSSSSGAARYT